VFVIVELRLCVVLTPGQVVQFSRTIVLPSAPAVGLVLFLDPQLGSSPGVRVLRVGWLATRWRYVCWVEDESDTLTRLGSDPVALVQHYLQRGWLVTGIP
jgi:hypothetical protein